MKKRKVLICPLNWGLGHASRCVPIAEDLSNKGHQIVLASSGDAYVYLSKELPQFRLERLPDYNIKYWRNLPIWMSVLFQFPKLLLKFKKERRHLNSLVEKYQIDLIISDNRLGIYHKDIESIYISHQIQIKSPFGSFKNPATLLHQYFMKSFDKIWIPDVENDKNNLAGKLSHPPTKIANSTYIGWLSRLTPTNTITEEQTVLVLLSGIEPHRTELEKMVFDQITKLSNFQFVVVGGKLNKGTQATPFPSHIRYIPFANSTILQFEISRAKLIICRSGYSTLMDVIPFKKRLLLIPSPGQTEQEYLAKNLNAFTIKQRDLCLSKQIPEALKYNPIQLNTTEPQLFNR